jgi:hypothetical protein
MGTRRRAITLLLAATLVAPGTTLLTAPPASAAGGPVPAQFIGKMYSEVLGRAPDASGWQAEVSYFNAGSNCTQAGLKSRGRAFYLSTEFNNLGYDNAAKLLTLYRGAANTEPDQAGFDGNLANLNAGTLTWTAAVDGFFDSPYFAGLVPAMCRTTGPDASAYWFGYDGSSFNTVAAPNLPLTAGDTGFAGGTAAALQAILNGTPSGGTVYLAKKSVTRITLPGGANNTAPALTIPAGVTLSTTNVGAAPPTTSQYALMGRLVLTNPAHDGPAVKLMPGAKLKNVWFDGQKNSYDNVPPSAGADQNVGVLLAGGAGTEAINNRVSNSNGWRVMASMAELYGFPSCTNHVISGNFLTVYSSMLQELTGVHRAISGIEAWCKSATVTANTVVDATDWGLALIVFGVGQSSSNPNVSTLDGNSVVNLGNSLYTGAGYSAEGNNPGGQVLSFQGSAIKNNIMWASSRAHMTLVFQAGLRAHLGNLANIADYPKFEANQLGLNASNPLTTEEAYSISAGTNATVLGGAPGWITHTSTGPPCPLAVVAAGVTAGWSSWLGTPPTGWTDVDITSCIN